MSGLDELTREELLRLVIRQEETVQAQQKQIAELSAVVERQAQRITELEEEVARLRGGRPGSYLCIKPCVPKKEKGPRKKREHSFARKNLVAEEICVHALDVCPDCGRKLSGGSVKWRHQVTDIAPVKAKVVDHWFVECYCGACGKCWTPDANVVLAEIANGKRNIGIGLMSLIAHLKTVCRMPVAQIRKLLETLLGVKISAGSIVEILHAVAAIGTSEYDELLQRVRGSPVAHGDETGWRENGVNGYIWSLSNPNVRYYAYRHSRGSVVVEELLGDEFAGVLVTDFYAAYNTYDGMKQRCWVHLLRDLKALVEKNPDLPGISVWVNAVKDLYHRAKEAARGTYTEHERGQLRKKFESELLALAQPYWKNATAPERVLAERMQRFIGELFVFVQCPEVPSENNAAERAIRPAVVARKISGGTRSPKGSTTASILRSVFETWGLQGCNTIEACRQMIIDANHQALAATQ